MKLEIYFFDEEKTRPYVKIDGFKVPVKNNRIFYGYNFSRNVIDPAVIRNRRTKKVHPISLLEYEENPHKYEFVYMYEYERRNWAPQGLTIFRLINKGKCDS